MASTFARAERVELRGLLLRRGNELVCAGDDLLEHVRGVAAVTKADEAEPAEVHVIRPRAVVAVDEHDLGVRITDERLAVAAEADHVARILAFARVARAGLRDREGGSRPWPIRQTKMPTIMLAKMPPTIRRGARNHATGRARTYELERGQVAERWRFASSTRISDGGSEV